MNAKAVKWISVVLLCLLSACHSTHQQDLAENKLNPKASELNVQLGLGYMSQGDLSRAKMKLMHALEQDPKSPLAMSALAYFYEKTDDRSLAEQYHLRAISYAPHDGRILNNFGAFLCRTGRRKEADTYFMRAVQDMKYLEVASAYENAGLCAQDASDDETALTYFKKALTQDPDTSKSLENIVQILVKRGDYSRAQSYYQRYAKLQGISPKTLELGYKLARGLGDRLEARRLSKRLKALYPDSREAQQLKV